MKEKTDIKIIQILAKNLGEIQSSLRDAEENLYRAKCNVQQMETLKDSLGRQEKEARAVLEKYEPDYAERLKQQWMKDY